MLSRHRPRPFLHCLTGKPPTAAKLCQALRRCCLTTLTHTPTGRVAPMALKTSPPPPIPLLAFSACFPGALLGQLLHSLAGKLPTAVKLCQALPTRCLTTLTPTPTGRVRPDGSEQSASLPTCHFFNLLPRRCFGPSDRGERPTEPADGRQTDCKLTTEPTDRAEPRVGASGAVHRSMKL